jgi:16S rRNA (uracil1498-N3)-methyltransferase
MKHLPRFAISDDAVHREIDGTVRVTGAELHHMRDVMRLSLGTEVLLCSTSGLQYPGRIASFEPTAAIIALAATPRQQVRTGPRLILAAGVIKPARMDLMIEKAAELDASEFWPLMCGRSVVRELSSERQQRWHRISLAAAKQSLRSDPMNIHAPFDVNAMVRSVPKTALAVTCMAGAEPLSAVIRRTVDALRACPPVIVIAIGPEGDFTAEELAAMGEAGFVAAGLSENRLRSETAALAALSIAAGIFAESSERAVPLKSDEELHSSPIRRP